jgi:hypothetical protein
MMARASGSIPTYTPSLYLPGSYGRYRQYPRVVRTQIPGAGVSAGKLVWGEQVLNLWGAPSAPFSSSRVPLLGFGQAETVGIAANVPRLVPAINVAYGVAGGLAAGALAMHLMHRFRLLGMR